MALNRREFLRLGVGAALLVWAGSFFKRAFWPAPLDEAERRIFSAYLDTLIPADDETPAASALGTGQALIGISDGDRDYRRLLREGCKWLDRQAHSRFRRGFTEVGEAEREAVVAQAAGGGPDEVAWIFFARTRHDAFAAYYAQPQAWSGLSYAGPPQPVGFPDYSQAPRPAAPA